MGTPCRSSLWQGHAGLGQASSRSIFSECPVFQGRGRLSGGVLGWMACPDAPKRPSGLQFWGPCRRISAGAPSGTCAGQGARWGRALAPGLAGCWPDRPAPVVRVPSPPSRKTCDPWDPASSWAAGHRTLLGAWPPAAPPPTGPSPAPGAARDPALAQRGHTAHHAPAAAHSMGSVGANTGGPPLPSPPPEHRPRNHSFSVPPQASAVCKARERSVQITISHHAIRERVMSSPEPNGDPNLCRASPYLPPAARSHPPRSGTHPSADASLGLGAMGL